MDHRLLNYCGHLNHRHPCSSENFSPDSPLEFRHNWHVNVHSYNTNSSATQNRRKGKDHQEHLQIRALLIRLI
jgi:hypothetical protein